MVIRLTRSEAPDWVVARLAAATGAGTTCWVGVDGFGAAGKSALAAAIAARLAGAQVVAIDDFARPGLAGWDRDLFVAQVLHPLRAGRSGRYQHWDLLHARALDWAEVHPGRPVIVEGVSAIDVRLPVPWDVTVWVDVPAAERRARIRRRDPPALLAHWEQDWWPSEEAYARQQRPWRRVSALVHG